VIQFDGSIRRMYIVLLAALLGGGVAFRVAVAWLDVHLKKEPVAIRESLATVPVTLGSWQKVGQEAALSEAMVEELGTPIYLTRHYALNGDPLQGIAEVHLAYYTGLIDTVPHVPDRCWGASGLVMTMPAHAIDIPVDLGAWGADPELTNQATGAPYRVAWTTDPVTRRRKKILLPPADEPWKMTVTVFQSPSRPGTRLFGAYFFIANGRLTPSPYAVRSLAFELTDRFAYYCKVQMNAELPDTPDAEERFTALAGSLLQSLVPEVMRCLPDWSEVERSGPRSDPVAAQH